MARNRSTEARIAKSRRAAAKQEKRQQKLARKPAKRRGTPIPEPDLWV